MLQLNGVKAVAALRESDDMTEVCNSSGHAIMISLLLPLPCRTKSTTTKHNVNGDIVSINTNECCFYLLSMLSYLEQRFIPCRMSMIVLHLIICYYGLLTTTNYYLLTTAVTGRSSSRNAHEVSECSRAGHEID